MAVIDALTVEIHCVHGGHRPPAAPDGAQPEPCLTVSVRFGVMLDPAECLNGPLLGRVEIHAGVGPARRRLFDLVPGFLVDPLAGSRQSLEFFGELLGAALELPRCSAVRLGQSPPGLLRLSGRSMPDPSCPVLLPIGGHPLALAGVELASLEAVVLLRSISSGSRVSLRSQARRTPLKHYCGELVA